MLWLQKQKLQPAPAPGVLTKKLGPWQAAFVGPGSMTCGSMGCCTNHKNSNHQTNQTNHWTSVTPTMFHKPGPHPHSTSPQCMLHHNAGKPPLPFVSRATTTMSHPGSLSAQQAGPGAFQVDSRCFSLTLRFMVLQDLWLICLVLPRSMVFLLFLFCSLLFWIVPALF